MTIQDRVKNLIRIAARLIEVLDTEVDYLRAMRMTDVKAMQPTKAAAVESYEHAVRQLAEHKDALVLVAPALQAEFRAAAERLDAASTTNAQALVAARIAHDRVLKAIVEAVEATEAPARTYAATGTKPAKPVTKAPLSLTVDRRL